MRHLNKVIKAKWDATCEWISEHKVGVVTVASIVVVTIIGVLVYINKNESQIELLADQELPESEADTAIELVQHNTERNMETDSDVREFARSGFVRKLHEGWHPSPAKVAEAAEKCIELHDGETLVDPCTVTRKSA